MRRKEAHRGVLTTLQEALVQHYGDSISLAHPDY